jgi:hypothetical protein
VLSCLPGRVTLGRSENLKLIYFQLSRRFRSMTVCRNEHRPAERDPRQRLANDDWPRVLFLEVGCRSAWAKIPVRLVQAWASAWVVRIGAWIKARMGHLLEKMRG